MSYINFESARVKEELRNEKRKAREAVLEKAEADYKRRKEREQRAAERGDDKWMLPSLDAQLQPDSHKTKKKHKKEKKKNKEKKHKKKKHDSSNSSDSSETDEWVEKDASTQSASNSGPVRRDEWMTLPALFPCVSRDQIRAQKRADAPVDEEALKKKFLLDNPGQSERELNPFWKEGGKGLPQVEEPLPDSLGLAANSAGDHGVAWLRKALRRVQEQAKEQGRSEEAVAAERWGSLEKLKSMLFEAERRCRSRPRDGGRGHGRRGGRVQGPAPKPREYEDWREDPTAAADSTTAQSEVVGDKSRYRSWLGIKDPSPPPESSSEEDDFDYDKLDDPPVVEGMDIKEKSAKDKEKNLSEKDASEDDNEETDGKILFRSSKTRRENSLCIQAKLQAARSKLNAFGRKVVEKTTGEKDKEDESDDDDEKLFEDWRNERKTKGSDESDESGKEMELKEGERSVDKKGSEQSQKTPHREEKTDRDVRKVHPLSSDDLRERFFQNRNKERQMKDVREKEKEDVKEIRRGSDNREERMYSNNRENQKRKDDSLSEDKYRTDTHKEKRKNWNEETKDRSEISNDKYENRENSELRRDERELDRRKSGRERMNSSFRDRRRDENDQEERNRYDERERRRGNSRERYDSRNIQRREDSGYHFNRDRERDDSRESKIGRRGRGDGEESLNRNRDRQTGSRRTEIPDYLRKRDISPMQHERAPRRLEGFQKPEDDLSASKSSRHDILGDSSVFQTSSGTKNWRKKEFCKPEEKIVQKEQTPPSNFTSKPLPTIQPSQVKEKEEQKEKQPDVQMSDAEMNALGAKVMKAELLGNNALAAKLKAQLEQAQIARKQRGNAPPAATAATTSKTQEEETVILTQRDSKGFVRPVEAPSHLEPTGGRRKPRQAATHGADGFRERYFPDDDKYTLENMFQKEKMSSVDDANEEFYRLISKEADNVSSANDLDDIFAEKISREKAPGKLQVLERNRAIQQHKRVERSLDSCTHCFDSPKMLKHLMVALGSKVYLSLPAHQSLTEGHCLLSPIHHVPCCTQLDEDVWEEMNTFRKALVAMFLKQERDCVFYESAMHLQRFPHMVLECVPLPQEVGDTAPIYFKKAIMESEAEWSMNKKLVDLKGKGVRRAVPKGLPYFAVDFGNDDGFAHVIEDEKLFPENFAQEIIGGMLDLHHSLWRKQKREKFDDQRKKVVEFAKLWKKFDVTKKAEEDSSDTSSDSDKE